MEQWAPVLVTLAVNAVAVAFFYGVSWQKVKGNSERLNRVAEEFEKLDREQDEQWSQINRVSGQVERIKGKLGMNGSA